MTVHASPDVRVAACTALVTISTTVPVVTVLFAPALVRSLAVASFQHRSARIRVAALDAVEALVCLVDESKARGAGSEAMLTLLGARDPNVVPIAAFYGPDVSINHFARLIADPNV